MRVRHWFTPVRLSLSVVFVLLAILAGTTIERFTLLEQKLKVRVPETAVWEATQSEIELGRFLVALDRLSFEPTETARATVAERYEVLMSRLLLYRGGTIAQAVGHSPGIYQRVERFLAELDRLDPILASIDAAGPTGAHDVKARLEPYVAELKTVTLETLAIDREARIELSRVHDEIIAELVAFGLAVLATTLLLLGRLFYSERTARRLLSEAVAARGEADAARTRLLEAIESINEGFVLYDRDDRLVLCNEKYRGLYHISADLIVPGARFKDILLGGALRGQYVEANGRVEAWLEARMANRKRFADRFEQPLIGGRWIMGSDRPTSDGGVVGIRTDITELKERELDLRDAHRQLELQAETMRVLADKAQLASGAKSEFLAMISHEIRTPMNAVIGLSNLLLDTRLDAEQRRFSRGIAESAQRLLDLINDVLDLSRLEAGRMVLEEAHFDPRATVAGAVELVRVLANEKGLALAARVRADVPSTVIGDSGRLYQILVNLLGNAVKFTNFGRVDVEVTASPPVFGRCFLTFAVADTGPGLPPDMIDRLFQPFEQGEPGSLGRREGSGLGLAICKRFVDLMGGTIVVDSKPGAGARFQVRIEFAIARDSEGLAGPDAEAGGLARPLRILVAEDTPSSQFVVQSMLEKRGHQVRIVDNGASAIEAVAADGLFDLVMLDLQMPIMGGLEAAHAIRALGLPASVVPIVAVTAQALATDRRRALDAGMDYFLAKPIRPNDLDRILTLAFGHAGVEAARQGEREATGAAGEDRAAADGAAMPRQATIDGVVIDHDLLGVTLDAVGPEAFRRILLRLRQDVAEQLGLLDALVARGDVAGARQAGHRLAGLFGQFGATTAATLAAQVDVMPTGRAWYEAARLLGDVGRNSVNAIVAAGEASPPPSRQAEMADSW